MTSLVLRPFKPIVRCGRTADLDLAGGGIASGMMRFSAIENRPFSKRASPASTKSASWKCRSKGRQDATMPIVALTFFIGALAGNGEPVLLRDHLDILGPEAGDGSRDRVAVVTFLQDVEGRIAVVVAQAGLEQVEQSVEADR